MHVKRKKGFSFVELLVVVAIFSILVSIIALILMSGRSGWSLSETRILLSDNLRQTIERISKELRESGKDKFGVLQVAVGDNTGANGSDILTFSIPVLCEVNMSVMDGNGDVHYWGAPLTWGCTTSGCMDADNDCATVDYKSIQYQLNNSNQLLRRVLDSGGNLVRSDILATNVSDLQAVISGDQKLVTLTVTTTGQTVDKRQVILGDSMNVYLRNGV